ncbi:SMI1/KNR4 family protein [Streptococcus sp. E29BA]|uniref:SMI1/KNR4 family protein n=1 Tax=Streptococcus sp. E29BA TaxID=3278716 RepID=UPI00359E2E67
MLQVIEEIKKIHPLYHSSPASSEQIKQAESELQLTFSDDFKTYLSHFGAVSFEATEWMGLNVDDYCHVVVATLEARKYNEHFPKDKFIVEDWHMDNYFILSDKSGNIYSWDNGTEAMAYESLLDYLKSCLNRASSK